MTIETALAASGWTVAIIALAVLVAVVLSLHRQANWFDDEPEPGQGDLFEDRPPPVCPGCGERQLYAAAYGKCYKCGKGIE